MALSDLYGIVVHVATIEETGEDPERWAAAGHREIEIKGAASLATKQQHTVQEARAAFEWVAGIICRAAVVMSDEVVGYETRSPAYDARWHPEKVTRPIHYCSFDPESHRCGVTMLEGVAPPRGPERVANDSDEVPRVSLYVPTENVEQWAATFRRVIAAMVADNLAAQGPSIAEHQPPILTETSDTTIRSTPR